MTKRVCIVRFGYYPYDLLVLREATALKKAGFDVHVLCLRGIEQLQKELHNGIQIHRMPIRRKKGGAARYLFEYFAFFLLVAFNLTVMHLRQPFRVIQVNTLPDFLVFATLIPYLLGAKVVLQMYEPMPELWMTKFGSPLLFKILQTIEQLGLRYAHATFAVTQTLKETFVSRGADPDKITVILNVSDPSTFAPYRETSLSKVDDRFTLICHGAIEERYGHDTMVAAIAEVREQIPSIRLNILGNGSYREEFLQLIEQNGLQDHIYYLGFVPLAQLVQLLETADVGIVAQKANVYSHLVHTGKMYDYLEFCKPIMVTRLRATCAYFDEESFQYFEPGDPSDLARVIIDLYNNPEKRNKLVQRSTQLYKSYCWPKQREKYLTVYHQLAGISSLESLPSTE